jgi:hypothetical protein
MCNIDYVHYAWSPDAERVMPISAVEVTRTDDEVLLGIVHIPRKEWWDFIGGIYGRTFDDTLPSADDFALLDAE